MKLFTVENRNIDEIIYEFCDPLSLFRLRRCCVYLRDSIKEHCYDKVESQLYVNNWRIGWNSGKTEYHTDEYVDMYEDERIQKRLYYEGYEVVHCIEDRCVRYTNISYFKKAIYQDMQRTHSNRIVISTLTDGSNYMDFYYFFRNDRYVVLSYLNFDTIRIYSRNGLILEIQNCKGRCKVINYVNSGNYYGIDKFDLQSRKFYASTEPLLNIVRANLKKYL